MLRRLLFVTVCLLCVSATSCKKPGGPGANPFIGKWSVHLDRTMAEGKKSPKYDEKDQAKMVGFITTMMNSMRLEITAREIIFIRGNKKTAQPYSIKSRDAKAGTMTVTAKVAEAKIDMVFTIIEADFMNLKSVGSDDMDYYIWQRESDAN